MNTQLLLKKIIILVAWSLCFIVSANTYYVDVNCPTPTPPYTNWITAATNIQDAIDTASSNDTVLVADGVYDSGVSGGYYGGARVGINKNITVQSVNGPEVTFIVGSESSFLRCVNMSAGLLSGFTVTNGHTQTGYKMIKSSGGGVFMYDGDGVVSNCVLTGNSAGGDGGGSSYGTLYNCIFIGNSAQVDGGGCYGSKLYNCTLSENRADAGGGGSAYSQLNNCTITENSASSGGGTMYGGLNNCIIWNNSAENYSDNIYGGGGGSTYCCSPDLTHGVNGNITNNPLLVSSTHISTNSPCRRAGDAAYAIGTDIDGEAWCFPPSIGCDEIVGSASGNLSVSILSDNTVIEPGYELNLIADITGVMSSNRWDFGDGASLQNMMYAHHAWTNIGQFSVVLTAWNETFTNGVSVTARINVVDGTIHYADRDNPSPVFPYITREAAATNINDAIEAASSNDTVLVADGMYDNGIRVGQYGYARVLINKDITVQSMNGPNSTFIIGEGDKVTDGIRGVYMTVGVLSGFTISNGHARLMGARPWQYHSGGGIYMDGGGSATNCVLTENWAGAFGGGSDGGTLYNCTITDNSADWGGGSYGGTLINCVLSGNSAVSTGGGSDESTLYNCTLFGNSAHWGGGSSYSTLNNCIAWGNTTDYLGTNVYSVTAIYSCAPDLITGVDGNITNNPLFVSPNNYHLAVNSPCIDAGTNIVEIVNDIDGTARPIDGDGNGSDEFDIGAYEYSSEVVDSDSDGITDYDEQVADTDMLDKNDWFHITRITVGSSNTVSFNSSAARQYTLFYSTNLIEGAWTPIVDQTDIIGSGSEEYLSAPTTTTSENYYKVEVAIP